MFLRFDSARLSICNPVLHSEFQILLRLVYYLLLHGLVWKHVVQLVDAFDARVAWVGAL